MKAYYARPISIDDTPQYERDIQLINSLGFDAWPSPEEKIKILDDYNKRKERGEEPMPAFQAAVLECQCVVFRSFPDGSIGAGVYKEIEYAREAGIPVVEIPRQIDRRAIGVNETRAMLEELGQR